jgi:hypothetical protein
MAFKVTFNPFLGNLDFYKEPGSGYPEVSTYNDLPIASTAAEKIYIVTTSQGTKWLPWDWGGTYYPSGLYYSNGITWEHLNNVPYQANQSDVNAGIITDEFVSPFTLAGWWANIKTLAHTFMGLITLNNVLIKRVYFEPVVASFSGTYTANLSTGNKFILTMTGNGTLDFSNAQPGTYSFEVNTAGFTLTLAVGKFRGEAPSFTGVVLISGDFGNGSRMTIACLNDVQNL